MALTVTTIGSTDEWKVWRHALAEFAQKVFQEAH
jgi:hypothetical protein